ncbi:hypothetical protein ACS0TY_011742 [Phlomoides rotata]
MSVVLGGDLEGGEEDVLNLDFALTPTVVRTICLVGKICAPKAPNVFTLIEVMVKAFKPKGKLTVREWGKMMVMFSFERANDRVWVIRNQP